MREGPGEVVSTQLSFTQNDIDIPPVLLMYYDSPCFT